MSEGEEEEEEEEEDNDSSKENNNIKKKIEYDIPTCKLCNSIECEHIISFFQKCLTEFIIVVNNKLQCMLCESTTCNHIIHNMIMVDSATLTHNELYKLFKVSEIGFEKIQNDNSFIRKCHDSIQIIDDY